MLFCPRAPLWHRRPGAGLVLHLEGSLYRAEYKSSEIHYHHGGGDEETWTPSITEDYYITYTDQEGKTVEAMLSNPGDHKFEEGDRLRIKYLPDKQEYPVMVENC